MTELDALPSSPYATGGGGVDFETDVVGYYLANALTESISRGLPDAIVQSVTLQAAAQGEPLDDIIVRGERSDGVAKLSLQVKRTISFTESDEDFIDVVGRVWRTVSMPEFRVGIDSAGVATGVYQRQVDEHYQRTLTWARTSATSGDFFVRINTEGLSHERQRAFVQTLRTLLGRILSRDGTDEEVWRFCRAFVILYFDFQIEGSRDTALTEAVLRGGLLLEDATRAADLRETLVTQARRFKHSGGTATTDSLRTLIAGRFTVRPTPDVRHDLQRLHAHAGFVLGDISRSIAGVALPRPDVALQAGKATENQAVVFITGPAGSGKSAVLATMYEDALREGAAILLSGERLFGAGWDAFAHGIGLASDLRDIIETVGTSVIPTLFIDGIDRAETPDKRRVVNDLLRVVASVNVTRARPWRIVASAREQNVQAVLEWAALQDTPDDVTVPDLTLAEVSLVVERVPQLGAIAYDARLAAVTHNAFMLDRLTDPRILRHLPAGALTEVTLANVWWQHVVSDGTPGGRAAQQALLRVAVSLVAGDVAAAAAVDARALHLLEANRVIAIDLNTSIPRFLHDVYEDWALFHAAELHRDDLRSFVSGAAQPFRLRRAIRLYGSALLERGEVDRWRAALTLFESDPALAARWRFAFLSSPLLSVRSDELLSAIRDVLYTDNGRRVVELFRAARTIEVAPNRVIAAFASAIADSPEEALALVYHEPEPRWSTWRGLVGWIVEQAESIPTSARPEGARILELWQVQTTEGIIHRRAVADSAWRWLTDRAEVPFRRREDSSAYYARLRRIILHSADVRPEIVKEMMARVADNYSDDAHEQLLRESACAKYIAKEYVDAVLTILLPQREDDDHWHLDYGFPHVRDMYPPAHVRPPFLTLLAVAEAEALRLIHSLANTAIDRWRRHQENEWDPIGIPVPLRVSFPWGEREFWGGPHEYIWFRGNGTGPHAVISGLMALEVWMEGEIKGGRDAEELYRTVLSGSRCIALPALCLGLALEFPEKCLRAALPIVAEPLVWILDVQRLGQDMAGTFNYDPTGQNEFINKLRKDRDSQPQRRVDVRSLAPRYLFGDESIAQAFAAAIARFTENVPVLYEEQRRSAAFMQNTRETLERYQAAATAENYRLREADEGIYLEVEMPNAIVERDAPDVARLTEQRAWTGLWMWGERTLKNGAVDNSLTPQVAIEQVREWFHPEFFQQPFAYGDGPEGFRLQGVAAGAAALAVACSDVLHSSGAATYIRDVLLAAAAMPEGDVERDDPRVQLPWHPRAYAARGLAALIRDGDKSRDICEAYLRLACSIAFTTASAASSVLAEIWRADRDLAWRAIVATVERSRISPWHRGGNPAHAQTVDAAVAALHAGTAVSTPRIQPGDEFYFHVFNAGFSGVPLEAVLHDTEHGPALLGLIEDLAAWTLTEHETSTRRERIDLYEWTYFFSDVLAISSATLSDATYDRVIRGYLRAAWRLDADLVPRFVSAFLNRRLSLINGVEELDVNRWHELVDWILGEPDLRRFSDDYRNERLTDTLAYFVFVAHGKNFFKATWPHAHRFQDDITKWVSTAARVRRAYRWLLVFLDRFSDRFPVEVTLLWLCLNTDSAPPVDMFDDGDTGDRLASVLLRIWNGSRREILDSPDMERRYASMIDHLLLAGITIANLLAERLARRE